MKHYLKTDLRILVFTILVFLAFNIVLAYLFSIFFQYTLLIAYLGLLFIESSFLLILGGVFLFIRTPPSSSAEGNHPERGVDTEEQGNKGLSFGSKALLIGGGLFMIGMMISLIM